MPTPDGDNDNGDGNNSGPIMARMEHTDADASLNGNNTLEVIYEEHQHAPTEDTVRFSAPQDVRGEKISFSGTKDQPASSAEGVVDCGKETPGPDSGNSVYPPRLKTRRVSSLELRKQSPDSVLLHDQNAIIDDIKGRVAAAPEESRGSKLGFLHRLFLNPSYPLRRQMLLTFGTVSSLTILLVMIVSIIASISTGNAIKMESYENLDRWVDDIMGTTSRYVAEALSSRIIYDNLVELMVEVGRDRFMGYPTTEDDSLTPFSDAISKTNVYPLKNNPLPLDWDFRHTHNEREGNVNATNYAEHVQDRFSWWSSHPRLSTASAMYHMQGACDPRAKNSSAKEYYTNCSEANNDITTGGVVAPSPTNAQVYRKAADLSPFLKAFYEQYQDMFDLGYYFSNSGAGSSVNFPHYELDSSQSYESVGCEWMREPNPIDPKLGPIGTDEEIARCHPPGKIVPTREYNPLERAWCRDQALDPSRIHLIGPYLNAWSDNQWLMSAGKAIYDPVTSKFVACIYIGFPTDGVKEILEEVQVELNKLGTLILTRNDVDGTVVAESKHAPKEGVNRVKDLASKTEVSHETFNEIKSLVDFSEVWNPKEASRLFETTIFEREESVISAYPVPPIPDEYDSTYVPEFFVIFSLQKSEGIAATTDNVSQAVDEHVESIIIFTLIVGVIGLFLVILLILATASWFVEPLKWMHTVGDQVVGKFGENLDGSIDYERKKTLPCSPKTELSGLVEEFSKMISRFSGEGTAKIMRSNDTEKVNLFDFTDDFAGLYQSRNSDDFVFKYPNTESSEGKSSQQCHLGPNTRQSPKSASVPFSANKSNCSGKAYKSPLFHWMVGLIVTPILSTTIVISVVVLWQISNKLPYAVVPARDEYLSLRDSYRSISTTMLAAKASAVTERAARDTHLLRRFAAWLSFDGINMSGSFTDVIEGAEECKTAPNASACEWARDFPCDCAWDDFYVRDLNDACTEYPPGKIRSLQKVHFEAQSQDAEPDGSYYSTSFESVAYSPDTTAWWDNIAVLPQASAKNSTSTRYDTSYDRVHIISALSTVFIPLYNYDKSNDKPLGLYVGYEADGMLAGYAGCDYSFSEFPFWKSTEENGAASLRPELCPVGKFGYDARCRGWYDFGKRKSKAGNGTLHITAPYVFFNNLVAQSITSPLINPQNNEHIGQVLVDFLPNSIFKAVKRDRLRLAEGGFPIIITPQSDELGHNTVVGPGYSLKDGGIAIEDLLQVHFGQYDNGSFDPILQKMKAGETGRGSFFVGDSHKEFKITYAPVNVRSYRPLDSSDISRGVMNETNLVYSLALVESEYGIIESFQSVDDFASKTVSICIGVLSALIAISTLLVVFIAFRVTSSMTEPILQLLDVLKSINCMSSSTNNNVAQLSNYEGSCREVDSAYRTMEMLYKVVQYANVAFFSGDLELAYRVLRDALRLFTRLDNHKAIAVASNNLGITMLTIYRTLKASGDEELCGMSKVEIVQKGTAYFAQSIKLGEVAYDEFYDKQGWSEECLAFMQFLANRYFNRAIFLLTTSCDHNNQKEAESIGFRDLQITADMDVEIVDQCVEMGFKINRVERYELMMSRIRGLLALVDLGYSPDELFVDDQIKDIYQDLTNAMKNPSHELFKEVSVAGRMQKLDVELIKYLRDAKHDSMNAARVAIRMLVEDEYLFPDAELEAVKMLLIFMNTADDKYLPKDEDGCLTKELQLVISSLENDYAHRVTSLQSSFTSSGSARRLKSLKLSSRGIQSVKEESETSLMAGRRSSAVRESVKGDFTMELF